MAGESWRQPAEDLASLAESAGGESEANGAAAANGGGVKA